MELLLLGTAAAEGWPAPYCLCAACEEARKRGGANLRARSGALIDDDLKIDHNADTVLQMQRSGRNLARVRTILFTHQHSDHIVPGELAWAATPFTNTPPAEPIAVYGNAEVVAMLQAAFPEPAKKNLDLRLLTPLEPVTTPTGDEVLPLPADHAPGALLLRITRNGKTLFYGHDSGLYPDATLAALGDGPPLDIALFDTTYGGSPSSNRGHMGLDGVVQMADELRRRGAVTDTTRLIATHFRITAACCTRNWCAPSCPMALRSPSMEWSSVSDRLFARLPRVSLGIHPTPLHPLPRLREHLGGDKKTPRLLIKRDDLNGVALGGNKLRKLEWLLGDAREQNCDTLVTAGAAQSNHCRLTAAVAAMHGLSAHLCLRGPEPERRTGNLILDDWLGATLHFAAPGENVSALMETVADDLRAAGRKPYIIPIGGSNAVGAVGYAAAAGELAAQCPDATHIVVATGSGGTQAGLEIGVRLRNTSAHLLGVGVAEPDTVSWNVDVARLADAVAERLGVDIRLAPDEIECPMDWMGQHYAAPTPECAVALELLARREGIFVDPVYSGKALAALIDWVRQGRFAPTDTVVFWHTGGVPALFAEGH